MTEMKGRGSDHVVEASMGAANVRAVCRAVRSIAGVEDMAVPKVSIEDYDALEDLLFTDVEEYLIATGWKIIRPLAESVPTVVYGKGGKAVLVGWSEDFADRPQRIGDIIEVVAEVERRSALEVYWDVRAARHGVEGAGFVVQPHEGGLVSPIVTVEAPIALYPDDRLAFHVIAGRNAATEEGRWTLTDNGTVTDRMDTGSRLDEVQLELIDAALRAMEPVFPGASWDGGEIFVEVETRDLGIGIVLFSQLCAHIALILRVSDERI